MTRTLTEWSPLELRALEAADYAAFYFYDINGSRQVKKFRVKLSYRH